jgi:hypothetical protein
MKKKLLLLTFTISLTMSLMAQKPSLGNFFGDRVPMYCSSGDTGRLPIIFRGRFLGLTPGAQYKYYTSYIAIGDTSSTSANGVGNPIFFKANGTVVYSTSPGFTANNHDTFTADGGGSYSGWFGCINTSDARFTGGKFIYPMVVFQEIVSSPVTKKWFLKDSINVLTLSTSAGSSNGTGIYGNSFAKNKDILVLYDDINTGSSRPISMTYFETETITVAKTPYWYTNKVNGVTGSWGTIIPNSLSNGIKRIESRNFANDFIVNAHVEADATWGVDSTKNPKGGTTSPIFISSDYAPLAFPDIQFVSNVTNVTEANTTVKLLVKRKYGNADTTKVTYNVVAGSATSTVDYTISSSNTINFKLYGEVVDTIYVNIKDDLFNEPNEDIAIKLTSAFNGLIGTQTTHTINIIDNDVPKVTFDKKGATVSEASGPIKIKLRLNNGAFTATNVKVVVKYRGDSTFIPQEFKFGSSGKDSTVQFAGGKVVDSLEFKMPIINDKLIEDRPDTIILALRNITSPGISGADSTFLLIINDNDAPPKYSFSKKAITVSENVGSVKVRVNILGRNATQSDIGIRLSSASTTTEGSDLTYSPTTQIFSVFPTDPDSLTLTIPILDNSINESTETAIFVLSPFVNAQIGKPDTLRITILDNDLPEYTLAKLTTEKTAGVADSLNVKCKIRGVVYGINMKPVGTPNGLSFTLIDATGGIQVFSNAGRKGYTVTEGDSVLVSGKVTQFEGLTRFDNLDTIIKLASGRNLKPASVVADIIEANESQLIKLNLVRLVNASQWPTTALAANTTAVVQVANQISTFDMLIDSDTDIDGTPAPSGFFNLTGIGSQSDASSPYTSGYQIVPRRLTDVENIASPTFSFKTATSSGVEKNDSTDGFIVQCSNLTSNQQITISIKGGTAGRNVDYQSNLTRTFLLTPAKPSVLVKIKLIDDVISEVQETIIWTLTGNSYGTLIGADSIHTVNIIDDETVSVQQAQLLAETKVFPNPAKNIINFSSKAIIHTITIVDMNGRIVKTLSDINALTTQAIVDDLSKGIYTAKIETQEGIVNKNFTIVE